MSAISAWILSIVGVCFISVITDIMLPEGLTNSYIKKTISYCILFIIILPLPKILNNGISVDELFKNVDITIQEDYITSINQKKIEALSETIENELKNKGIIGVDVFVSADIFDYSFNVDAVYIDLYNVVINDNLVNINIKTEVVNVVLKNINISKDKVIFYE